MYIASKYHDTLYTSLQDWSQKISDIFLESYGFKGDLAQLHTVLETDIIKIEDKRFFQNIPIFGVTDRTSCFVREFYKYYDAHPELERFYIDFVKTHIEPIFAEQLVVQKTPNLRVSIPRTSSLGSISSDPEHMIGLHKDGDFGHPKEEVNIIISATDMFDTNSLYFEKEPGLGCYDVLRMKKNNFWIGNLNECRHYNKINTTGATRVSLDLRVIPYSMFNQELVMTSVTHNKKFSIGEYYMLI